MARRLALIPLLAAMALPCLAAADAVTPATVKLLDCSRADRSATFHARMQRISGAATMGLRIRLVERSGVDAERFVSVPGLGVWHRSRAGVAEFGWRQVVRGLREGSLYRAQVDFRWYSEAGTLLAKARRRSAACRQYEALPNLSARVVGMRSTRTPGVRRYLVNVANRGPVEVASAPVRLSVDGAVVDTVNVPALLPGEVRRIAFRAPPCSDSVVARADPMGVVGESSEADNTHRLACADVPRA